MLNLALIEDKLYELTKCCVDVRVENDEIHVRYRTSVDPKTLYDAVFTRQFLEATNTDPIALVCKQLRDYYDDWFRNKYKEIKDESNH